LEIKKLEQRETTKSKDGGATAKKREMKLRIAPSGKSVELRLFAVAVVVDIDRTPRGKCVFRQRANRWFFDWGLRLAIDRRCYASFAVMGTADWVDHNKDDRRSYRESLATQPSGHANFSNSYLRLQNGAHAKAGNRQPEGRVRVNLTKPPPNCGAR
jgi:hypothetical protein